MMKLNDYFHIEDYHATAVNGLPIPSGWWSRSYEYPWAVSQARHGAVVADMGCGYVYRPLKDMLAVTCKQVWAVDVNPKVLETPIYHQNIYTVVNDISQTQFDNSFFDQVFCISVLEEVGKPEKALKEFHRILKPGGQLVLTFDVLYDINFPEHELYKGMNIQKFFNRVQEIGFRTTEEPSFVKLNALFNSTFNLCVYHTVLEAYK